MDNRGRHVEKRSYAVAVISLRTADRESGMVMSLYRYGRGRECVGYLCVMQCSEYR